MGPQHSMLLSHISMTHGLPLSKSRWQWSCFDESLSVLRQGTCVPSLTHNTVSAPFPTSYTPQVPILRAHPILPRFQQHLLIPHNPGSTLVFPRDRPALLPFSPPGSLWAPGCNGEGCHPLQPTPPHRSLSLLVQLCRILLALQCLQKTPVNSALSLHFLIFHTCPESASSHPG